MVMLTVTPSWTVTCGAMKTNAASPFESVVFSDDEKLPPMLDDAVSVAFETGDEFHVR